LKTKLLREKRAAGGGEKEVEKKFRAKKLVLGEVLHFNDDKIRMKSCLLKLFRKVFHT
jgi:hypothetical protein